MQGLLYLKSQIGHLRHEDTLCCVLYAGRPSRNQGSPPAPVCEPLTHWFLFCSSTFESWMFLRMTPPPSQNPTIPSTQRVDLSSSCFWIPGPPLWCLTCPVTPGTRIVLRSHWIFSRTRRSVKTNGKVCCSPQIYTLGFFFNTYILLLKIHRMSDRRHAFYFSFITLRWLIGVIHDCPSRGIDIKT